MSNIFINLSAISENTTVLESLYYFKGNPSINFILSGIDESINPANIKQPIQLIKESYYDNIQKLGITSTQMTGASGSNTVANLQSKFNDSTYITFLNN